MMIFFDKIAGMLTWTLADSRDHKQITAWPSNKSEGKFSLEHENCNTEERSMREKFENEGIGNLIWSV